MIPEIGEGLLSLDTTKDIWDTISETYSRWGNITHVSVLKSGLGGRLGGA